MDEIKVLQRSRIGRLDYLQEAFKEMHGSFENLGNISSSSKLPKRFTRERRHSIHVSCTSPFKDPPDNFINPLVAPYPSIEASAFQVPRSFEVATRNAHLPVLAGAKQNGLEPSGPNAKIKARKRNSWTWVRSSSEENHPSSLDPNLFPEIRRKPLVNRRHSLPVTTGNVTPVVSLSHRESSSVNNTTLGPLPQVTQPKNHNLQQEFNAAGIKLCTESTKTHAEMIPGRNDQAEAMQKHVERAETSFNRQEVDIKAARLFEWLKNQTSKDSRR